MATAYLKDINKIKVPLPIIKEQKRIVKILSSISRKQEIEEQILNQLKIQKQYLLGQMFIWTSHGVGTAFAIWANWGVAPLMKSCQQVV